MHQVNHIPVMSWVPRGRSQHPMKAAASRDIHHRYVWSARRSPVGAMHVVALQYTASCDPWPNKSILLKAHKSQVLLYCIVLYWVTLYCVVLCCVVLYCIVLFCVVFCCIALHCIASHYIVLYSTALHCTALQCNAMHCTVLYCIVLNCIVLYSWLLLTKWEGNGTFIQNQVTKDHIKSWK